MTPKSLLLYDFLSVKGGAESVSLKICGHYPNMNACFGFIDKKVFPSIHANLPGRITSLCAPTKILGWQTIKTAHAFKSNKNLLDGYETVIYSGSNAPFAVENQKYGKRIYYCHTPPRFVYDLKEHYLNQVAFWQRPLLTGLINYFQPRYQNSIDKMDIIIANSINVQQRIKHYLGKDSVVVYPPCNTDAYKWIGQSDYYLSTARLEPYKRVDLIVNAFKNMPDKKLIVASGGSQLEVLKRLANGASNIIFTGWCSNDTLYELMGKCIASIYIPINEDFGMSPVESMAAGKAVIGVNEGGVAETILEGVTGVLCPAKLTKDDICDAVSRITSSRAKGMRYSCEMRADTFKQEIFFDSLNKLI